jgi:hypothetical protein
LLVAGAISAPVFYFVAESIPLTALALSAVLLGVIALLLGRSLPQLPPRAAQVLLETGLDNLAGLLEELGLEGKAVYLPSKLAAGRARALIPLNSNSGGPEVTREIADRLIVDYGPKPEDLGVLVTTPGTAAAGLLDSSAGGSSAELEAALSKILVGYLDVATSVQIAQEPGRVTASLGGVRFEHRDSRTSRALGTPLASIVATIVSEGLDRPITIESEERAGDRMIVRLEVNR